MVYIIIFSKEVSTMRDLFELLMLMALFRDLMERLDIEYIAIKRAKK